MDAPAPTLPVLLRRREIEDALRAHQVLVLCGETGSGKTTQLPQILLPLIPRGAIAHTQPRRLAARAVAARIAEETNSRLGALVGVKVRFQDQTSRDTRIKLMTDGMLLAELAEDPDLRAYAAVIIDEAHERSLNIDFLLGYLRRLLPRRPDLKVIITSATIDPARFSAHFGGPAVAPVLEVSGRMYPVAIRYMPPDAEDEQSCRLDPDLVADAVDELTRPSLPEGDVLVFLPGEREIRTCADTLRRRSVRAEVLPLLARLTPAEQDRVFHPDGPRRVILATNVAETSLTVPRVRYVVDTGLVRQSRYDPSRKVQRLPIEHVSRASANQRAGRSGRVADGICIRLYSESSYTARPAFTEPEIRRTNLASVVLQMASLNLGPVEDFPFLDPPDPAAIKDARETLFELGALDSHSASASLTPLGRDLARLPLDPRVARMLLAAKDEGSVREVTILAAALSIQDPRDRPMGRQDAADRAQLVFRNDTSDFLTLLNIWDQYTHAAQHLGASDLRAWCREHFLSHLRMREWSDTVRQLRDIAEELELPESPTPAQPDAIHRALLTGLASNVACRDADGGSFDYRGIRSNVLAIFPGSALFKKAPKWIMAAEVVHTTRLYARTVARIEVEWLEQLVPHMLQRVRSDPHLDPATAEPSIWERTSVNSIVVAPRQRVPLSPIDPTRARTIFLRDALADGVWRPAIPWVAALHERLDLARAAEARLRRRNVLRSTDDIAAWLDRRLPTSVRNPASLQAALRTDPPPPLPELDDLLSPDARVALDPASFPDSVTIDAAPARITYLFSPGADDDAVTLDVSLLQLSKLTPDALLWLIPASRAELTLALLKTLPKSPRALLESKGKLEDLAAEAASLLDSSAGPFTTALAETLEVLHAVRIDPALFATRAVPAHLRPRVRVLDEHHKELAADRDLPALLERFASRIRKASAARARASFEQDRLTAWTFADLPERVSIERDAQTVDLVPTLIDETSHVRLTLLDDPARAAILTDRAIRRLFAIACAPEVTHRLEAAPEWHDMARQHQQLGTAPQLLDALTCLVAERAFMSGRALPRSRDEFESRTQEQWGRLGSATREVIDAVAPTLAHRAAVAQRLSGGTPRLWADSIADIREHAAYLMPLGFLSLIPFDRLRHYPRYAEGMRERLFALREGGSTIEKDALAKFSPYWKRFTGWAATAMNAQRAAEEQPPPPTPSSSKKAPLPQTRLNSPTVNTDAGAWACTPANLTPPIEKYRWLLEEARLALFVPSLALKPPTTLADLDAAWKKAT